MPSFFLPPNAGAGQTRLAAWRQRGVSLLEITTILLALVALSIALVYKTTDFFAKSQVLDSDALLRMADHQLRQYIVANGRLPCPDTNGDGISDGDAILSGDTDVKCGGQQKGYLPYKTLGMVEANYVYGEVPMLYGAYNDGSISFTSRVQTFVPDYADKTNAAANTRLATDPRNIFDFCASLGTLNALATPSASGISVAQGSTRYNAVYALAMPGQANRDGLSAGWSGGPSINAQYDGLNATSANLFEFPKAPLTPTYDDRTSFRTGSDLLDYFRCAALNESVSLLSEAITVQKETEDFADANKEDALKGVILNAVGIALATWELANTIAAVVGGIEVIGVSSGLLATAVGTCIVLVGCALIPVYTTALTMAITGTALATAASVTATAALGLQITATVLYADLVARTANAGTSTPPSTPTGFPADQLPPLRDRYVASNAAAQTAYNATLPSLPQTLAQYDTTQQNQATTVAGSGYIGGVTDTTLKNLLTDTLNGKQDTCTLGAAACLAAGYTELVIPTVTGSTPETTTITGSTTTYVKDMLPAGYQPGVIPSVGAYYDALLQQGITQPDPITDTATCITLGFASAPCTAATVPPPPDVTAALNSSNTVVVKYTDLLEATYDFDVKNLDYHAKLAAQASAQSTYNTALAAYCLSISAPYPCAPSPTYPLPVTNAQAALNTANTNLTNATNARTTALSTLRTAMGNPSWDHTGNSSLCGGGTTTGCGWMVNVTPTAGNSTTQATTSSGALNTYLTAYSDYQNARLYQQKLDAAAAKASAAWADRNTYKTALCSVGPPSVNWVGSASIPSANPNQWDISENLLATTPTGLNCSGGATPLDQSAEETAARAAEQARYCLVGGPDYNANLCALYSAAGTAASIQGSEDIVRELIRRGITK